MKIRAAVLDGQGAEGCWEADGSSIGSRIVGAAWRIRTLELLEAIPSPRL